MSKPDLLDALDNVSPKERIANLQALINETELKMRRVQQGDFRYRGYWLQVHLYRQEIEQLREYQVRQ